MSRTRRSDHHDVNEQLLVPKSSWEYAMFVENVDSYMTFVLIALFGRAITSPNTKAWPTWRCIYQSVFGYPDKMPLTNFWTIGQQGTNDKRRFKTWNASSEYALSGSQSRRGCVVNGPKPWPPPSTMSLRQLFIDLHRLFVELHRLLQLRVLPCVTLVCLLSWHNRNLHSLTLCCYRIREPYTELQGVTLRDFNLSRSNSSWELASDLVVVLEAGNPSKIAGFGTRFLHSEVDASYHNATLGSSSIP